MIFLNSRDIVGAGVQGFYQAWMAAAAQDLTDIYIYDQAVAKGLGQDIEP